MTFFGGARDALLSSALVLAVAPGMVACTADTPAAMLAKTPRVAAGPAAVRLVQYPCSRHGELLAPVDVEGHPTWLLVDTGSYRHVLLPKLVAEAGVRESWRRVLVGRDPGIRATMLLRTTMLSVPGVGALPFTQAISFNVPGLAECGTGGVLSPARMASEQAAVIVDLSGARLALAAPDAALEGLARRAGAAFEATRLPYESFAADAVVDERPARLLVDTGACCTWVYRESAVGQALASRADAVRAGPSDIQNATATHRLRGARVRTGEVERALDVYLIPGGPPPEEPDGALGIDVLKACVLVIHGGVLRARCEPPPGR